MPRRVLILAVLAGVLGGALPAAPARADAFDEVFADYRRDGKIDPCAHSEAELKAARGQVPNDIEQYASDFPAALDEALENRARAGCGKGDEQEGTTAAAPGAAPGGDAASPGGAAAAAGDDAASATPGAAPVAGGSTVPQPPGTAQPAVAASDGAIVNAAARDADKGGDAPAPLLVLAILGGVALLALLVWALARLFAWDPAWVARTRHAIAEAGWRTSAAWADFADWVRGDRSPGARPSADRP